MCFKDSTYLKEALEEIKNLYIIIEEDTWGHFFVEMNNNYIEEENTSIWTLT